MPSSRRLISSQTLTTTAASVTFSSIPAGYTDLILRWSLRSNTASVEVSGQIKVNGSSSNYTDIYLRAQGTSPGSGQLAVGYHFLSYAVPGASATSNTFGSGETYIPNYSGNAKIVLSTFAVSEDNSASGPGLALTGDSWGDTSAITSISFTPAAGDLVSGTSFYLYGLLPA